MNQPDRASIFFEVADILSLIESRHPKPAANKLRHVAKLLVEAGNAVSRLPENSGRSFPREDLETILQSRKDQAGASAPIQDVVWALDKIQTLYTRPMSRKLAKPATLIQDAAETEG